MTEHSDVLAKVRQAASEHSLTEGLDPAALAWLISTGEVETYSEGLSETLGWEQVRFTRRMSAPNAEQHRAAARQAIDRGYWVAFQKATMQMRPVLDGIRDQALSAIVETDDLNAIQSIGRSAEATLRDWQPAKGEGLDTKADFPPPERAASGDGISFKLGDRSYPVVARDALTLVGALAMAVDGETARIKLASGDVLELTHQDVSDIGRQLAGKPADEVSG